MRFVQKILFLLVATLVFSWLNSPRSMAQEVYVHVSNTDLYDFLDELANAGWIDLNSAVKPYARTFIAKKLSEAGEKRDQMNPRQQKDLDVYLREIGRAHV